tara:strand:+ start:198 stop:647 length:450 start_codon:yes stop_codon:yes gene_type:complete
MLYEQKVILKDVKVSDVIHSFHDRKFVDFLTALQPVKILNWDGIESGKVASFSFWFFGWKGMKVIHEGYESQDSYLRFIDKGLELPFGLRDWNHHHIVEVHGNNVVIVDRVRLHSQSRIKLYFIYPIMIFPILIRKISYKIWFYKKFTK